MPAVIDTQIIIPACKKDAFFTDDLMMKIGQKSLIEHVINLAIALTDPSKVTVFTDSHEVSSVVKKYNCNLTFEHSMSFKKDSATHIAHYADSLGGDLLIMLSPYLNNLSADNMIALRDEFWQSGAGLGFSARRQDMMVSPGTAIDLDGLLNPKPSTAIQQLDGFIFCRPKAPSSNQSLPLMVPVKARPVRSIDEFWLAERQQQARTIIFRIIGNSMVGMGHIHRSISLAKMLLGHDIQFICHEEDKLAIETVAEYHFPVLSLTPSSEAEYIAAQAPDLIINDTLSTTPEDIAMLKQSGAKLITLEDKGAGLDDADAVINEIFSSPPSVKNNVYAGYEYAVLRDEFFDHDPDITTRVGEKHCLISFGGSDPSNYTQLVLGLFDDTFADLDYKVSIILGQGYAHKHDLHQMLASARSRDNIAIIEATDEMGTLMASADLAFCGNGRMVFELAQMRLPAIIMPQHERETTHDFAQDNPGFCYIGMIDNDSARATLKSMGDALLSSDEKRLAMSSALSQFDFMKSKQNVFELITSLLGQPVRAKPDQR